MDILKNTLDQARPLELALRKQDVKVQVRVGDFYKELSVKSVFSQLTTEVEVLAAKIARIQAVASGLPAGQAKNALLSEIASIECELTPNTPNANQMKAASLKKGA